VVASDAAPLNAEFLSLASVNVGYALAKVKLCISLDVDTFNSVVCGSRGMRNLLVETCHYYYYLRICVWFF
jgi:hypothetical protein